MSGNQNLIIGLWTALPFARLEPFLASLRRTTFQGDLCLVVADVEPDVISEMLSHGILVQRMDRLSVPVMAPQAMRYFACLDFLARHGESYANVMLSDVRDVVFQSDPFAQPLPADVVFTQEPCLIGDAATEPNWIADLYGAAVANNLRNCPMSTAGTTFGTVAGVMRYLVGMTTELMRLVRNEVLRVPGSDAGVHNFLVRMRAPRHSAFDPPNSRVGTVNFIPDTSITPTPDGVLIDGRPVPVLHRWDRNETLAQYVRASPRFLLQPGQQRDLRRDRAVVAFYHPPRDADWLASFLISLRRAGYGGQIHCTGVLAEPELALLAQYGCVAHPIEPVNPELDIESVAHLFLSRVLDQLADTPTEPEQVLVMDSVRAAFLRDPFESETIGLSVFHESATRVADSEFNLHRLAKFVEPEGDIVQHPVVSSALLRGKLSIVREFYRRLFVQFIGRAELLRIHKMMQGAINKLCHGGIPGMDIVQYPNGGEAYLEIWEQGLPIRTEPLIRVGSAVPFVVLNLVRETELMRAIRARLRV